MESVIVAIDEGTTSTRAIAVDIDGRVRAQSQATIDVTFPKPGWVEQDPQQLWERTHAVLADVFRQLDGKSCRVASLGLCNQRETAVFWDRNTGKALHPAIVWQCRRTEEACAALKTAGCEEAVLKRTGLPIDPYFSATKMAWMLDAVEGGREMAARGRAALGTVDAWLLYNLTGRDLHATDVTNASRTQLLDIASCRWDHDLAEVFRVPLGALPEVRPTGSEFGRTRGVAGVPDGIPIAAAIGDSQAALFGEAALEPGMAKVTYGTGSSVMIHAGDRPATPENGLAATVAWHVGDDLAYALEGVIHAAGAAVQWLHEGLGILDHPDEAERMALEVADSGGVIAVPAFSGMGTPWWDASARGLVIGLTRGTRRHHIVRAVLDSIAFQVADVFRAVPSGAVPEDAPVFAGGGGSRNAYLMQLQADLLGRNVMTCDNAEASAMGAAYIAGIVAGMWSRPDVAAMHDRAIERTYAPRMPSSEVDRRVSEWRRAVARALRWTESQEVESEQA